MDNIEQCRILLVDDEIQLLYMTKEILSNEGFEKIYTASTCKEAMEKYKNENPHIVVLDVMLPDGDGFSILKRIRQESIVPALFLSAKDEDESRLMGLGLGADDYITKPFIPKELVLRLKAILKRSYLNNSANYIEIKEKLDEKPVITLGNISIDMNSGSVEGNDKEATLTAKEYALLNKLYANKGNIVTIDSLCKATWGDDFFGYENTLMVHIRRLREKIEEDPSHPKYLLTVRGLGYKLVNG